MDLNEMKKLAGIICEENTYIHYSDKRVGAFGSMIVVEGVAVKMLDKIFKTGTDWKLKKVGDGWAACDGERFTFFENKNDFVEDDE